MQPIAEKAKKIRLVIFDVDGILTSGHLFYSDHGIELKAFDVRDGLGIKLLQKSGVEIAIITARTSPAVTKRMEDLEIKHVYQGCKTKLPTYNELKEKLKLDDEQIAYMGDDLPDLPILRRVGLSISVPNAVRMVQQHVAWVTQSPGGNGAVREVSEFIMQAQGTFQAITDVYLQG